MRCTSEVGDTTFPFADDRTAFILVYAGDDLRSETKDGRGFEHASTESKKRELLGEAITLRDEGGHDGEVSLLAVWPGAKRSDVFLVDDLDEALAAFA
jgi:hypothetical protein